MASVVGRTRTEGLRTRLPTLLLSIVALLALSPLTSAQSPAPATSPTPTPSCAKTDFQCRNGSCIPRTLLCNGVSDCASGEDEGADLCGCLKNEFRCLDGTCISDAMLCDGKRDCPGGLGEDEAACTISIVPCSASKFFCGALDGGCLELLKVCDGVQDCFSSGLDERDCSSTPGSACSGAQFECGSEDVASPVPGSDCIPLREQCDSVFHCADGADESGCTLPKLIQPPVSQVVMSGDVINLTCIAEGTPTPTITWLKDLMPLPSDSRYQVTSVGGVGTLTISQATVLDIGDYSCEVSIRSYSFVATEKAAVNVTNVNPASCLGSDGSTYREGERFYTVVNNASGSALSAAADIVFVVDESGSMLRTQQWIGEMAPLLDSTLQVNGVGAGNFPNQFALVGYGGMNPATVGGFVRSQLNSVSNFVNLTSGLTTGGTVEDGYSGIQVALDQVRLRTGPEIVRVMVLITNEERTVLLGKENLTRDAIEEELREAGFVLNVVVQQTFSLDDGSLAFGMDYNGTCYAYDDENQLVIHPSCKSETSVGSTYEDYVQLAYNLQGSAWDIQAIEHLDDLSGLSQSFVAAKVEEVMGLLRHCFACTCKEDPLVCERVDDVALEDCKGRAPPRERFIVTVSPSPASNIPVGSDVVLTCNILISPEVPEDEITIQWAKNGGDLLCTPPDCGRTITLTAIEAGSEGLYTCIVTVGDDLEIGNTFLSTVAPPVIVIPPDDVTTREGKPAQATCVAEGKPAPLVYWVRSDGTPLSAHSLVEATNDSSTKLVIDPAALDDSGQYECVAVSRAGTASASFDIQVNVADCVVSDTLTLLPGESGLHLEYKPAVDLVLVVDESGSMFTEHQWLIRMVKELDEALKTKGVGVLLPNLIAVVGFGSQYRDYESGRVVSDFVSSDEIDAVIDDLWVDGKYEDGYVAIKFALDNLQFRKGTAKQLILITDEDRYTIDTSLSYDSIKKVLNDSDTRLSVIVSEKFAGDRSVPAMGVDGAMNAYVYYPLASYYSELPANLSVRVVEGGHSVPDTGHGSTHNDYTSLVHELGGAAWDLGLLSLGPPVADAFTSAFVSVEVQEILSQVGTCQNCTCGDTGLHCVSVYPFVGIYPECSVPESSNDGVLSHDRRLDVSIDPRFHRFANTGNQNTTLDCRVGGDVVGEGIAVEYRWTFSGRQLEPDAVVSTSVDGFNSLLTLVDPRSTSTGWYSCFAVKAQLTSGGVPEPTVETGFETAYVEVYEPVVILDPLRSKAIIGDDVSITASMREDGTFTWSYWDGSDPYTEYDIPHNAVVKSTSSRESVLTIANAQVSNSGLYICKGVGSTQQGSGRAEVFVNEPELKISVSEELVKVCTGSRAVVACQVDCRCYNVQLAWTLPQGAALPSGVTMEENGTALLLVIEQAKPEHALQYQCTATYGDNQRRTAVSFIRVISRPTTDPSFQLPAPELSLDPYEGFVVAPINSSVKVNCTSDVESAVITFHPADDSEELPEGVTMDTALANSIVFSIGSVTDQHYMKYACTVGTLYDDCGPEPVSSTFQIFKPGPALTSPMVDPPPTSGPIEVELGSSVEVRCTSNVPYAIFTWQRLHAPYSLPEGVETYEEGLQTSFLNISVMEQSMYGPYLCKVKTPPFLSEEPKATAFTIAEPDIIGVEVTPAEFTSPENLITEDNPMVIECAFTCTVCSEATLQWSYVGGSELPNGVTTRTSLLGRTLYLEISEGSPDQSGTYVCSAVMDDGTVAHSVKIDVTILVEARVWISQRSKKVPAGESAVFECHSSRTAAFSWNFNSVDGALPDTAFSKTISETESELNVSNVEHDVNTGKYFCAASFPTGELLKADADLSEQANLTVAFKVKPDGIILDEQELTVSSGDEVTVECSLTCGGRCPSATVTWLDGAGNVLPTSNMDGVWQVSPITGRLSDLKIASASAANTGVYQCRAMSSGETTTFTTLTIELQS